MNKTVIGSGIFVLVSTGILGCVAADPSDEEAAPGTAAEADRVGAASSQLDVLVGSYPTPSDVYIDSITTGGPGCIDPGTVSTIISSDRTSFLVIFDDMVLNNPSGPSVKNINCAAGVKLHIPNGWQFSVATIDTRGYAYLPPGIRGRQTSQYFFAGNPLGTVYHSTLVGPYDDNYSFTDAVPFSSVVWSPCGGTAIFAVNTSLNLNAVANPKGTAILNTETLDGSFRKIIHWQWQPC